MKLTKRGARDGLATPAELRKVLAANVADAPRQLGEAVTRLASSPKLLSLVYVQAEQTGNAHGH